jgi:diacylglycerol kinase (ATP)
LLLSLPVGWFLATTWRGYALLVGSLIVLMIVEVLNTAVEAACNALSREFNADIQLAKDCGSLAVLLAVLLAAGVWLLALLDRIAWLSP